MQSRGDVICVCGKQAKYIAFVHLRGQNPQLLSTLDLHGTSTGSRRLREYRRCLKYKALGKAKRLFARTEVKKKTKPSRFICYVYQINHSHSYHTPNLAATQLFVCRVDQDWLRAVVFNLGYAKTS